MVIVTVGGWFETPTESRQVRGITIYTKYFHI